MIDNYYFGCGDIKRTCAESLSYSITNSHRLTGFSLVLNVKGDQNNQRHFLVLLIVSSLTKPITTP